MIKNLKIVITGTSQGIGYELTKKFLNQNNFVWGCSRKKSNIKNANYFHTQIDLTNKKQIKKWVIKIEKETKKKIDIFISNAANYERSLNALDNSGSITRTIGTNLTAPILLTNLLSKSMIQNKFGIIIFFSSVASILHDAGTSAYASSKSGLETFSKILKKELEIFNVKVFVLRLIYLKTSLSKKLSNKQIKKLKNKFKTDNYGSINKIYGQINRIYKTKKKIVENLIFDKQNV